MVSTKKEGGSCLLLDLGEVLIPLNFQRLFKAFDLFKDQSGALSVESLARWDLYDKFERGHLNEDEFRGALSHKLGREISETQFRQEWNSVFDGEISGVNEFLHDARKRMPVFALTNTNVTHMAEVKRLYPWLATFNDVFTSYELGARKPEREIFEKALQKMGVAATQVTFVDDRRENVEAAKTLGIQAHLAARDVKFLRSLI